MKILFLTLLLGLSLGFILANITFRFDEGYTSFNSNLRVPAQVNSVELSHNSNNSNETADASGDSETGKLSLSELRQAINKADHDQNNLQLQRDLGIAVFRYSALEHRVDFLTDAIRLMERAAQKSSPKDKELHETLGNALFVEAQQADPGKMLLAREAYQKVLATEPGKADIIVNIGLTYFLEQPSNPTAAIAQYNRALKIQPRSEKALENMIIALLSLKQNIKAGERLEELREINPKNQALNDLEAQVNQALLNK